MKRHLLEQNHLGSVFLLSSDRFPVVFECVELAVIGERQLRVELLLLFVVWLVERL